LANLEEICMRYQAAGLYTHVYASCGFLHDKSPALSFASLPGERTVFDLSSLTKALVTTPLALWFCDRGSGDLKGVTLEALFGRDIVEKVAAGTGGFSLASLLRHESGLPAWRNFYVECEGRRQGLEEVINRSLKGLVGDVRDVYSDVGMILLGSLFEKATNKKLIELWWEVCGASDIKSSRTLTFGAALDSSSAISTGYCPVRRRDLIGEVHDENCWALGGFTGHAGLFAAGPDVERFLKDLWSSPLGRKVFDINFAEVNSPGESLMGWRKGRDHSANSFAEGRGCGHLGFTGTAFWVDPKTKAYAVLLTNRVISGRVSTRIKDFRREAFGVMWDCLKK
jgi:CubicO group peptidase (beta-lactamase class C family)